MDLRAQLARLNVTRRRCSSRISTPIHYRGRSRSRAPDRVCFGKAEASFFGGAPPSRNHFQANAKFFSIDFRATPSMLPSGRV